IILAALAADLTRTNRSAELAGLCSVYSPSEVRTTRAGARHLKIKL
ncbi:unnamed protein product, partial [Amoebophrya sp. A120]